MNILSLKYFIDVVNSNSFSKAAVINNISQGSISKHVSKLEKIINRKLLVRSTTSNSIFVTEDGLWFYYNACIIVTTYEKMLFKFNNE